MPNNHEQLLKSIIEEKVFTTSASQPIVTAGGRELPWLLDFRSVLMRPDVLSLIADIFWQKMDADHPFQVAGLESASLPLITSIVLSAASRGRPVNGFYIRKSRKKEGLMKIVEGEVTDEPVVLVDDIIHSGKSFIKQIAVLEGMGKKVLAVFALVRYSDMSRYEYFHSRGIKVVSVFELNGLDIPRAMSGKTGDTGQPVSYAPFKIDWVFSSPEPSYYHVIPKSVPALDASKLYFGSDNGMFWALNQADGSVAWKFPVGKVAGKSVFSSPAIYNGTVFFGGYDGNVYALDTESGKPRWVFVEADWVGSSPALALELGLLFIGTEYALAGQQGGIVAIDMDTGEKKWQHLMPKHTHSSPVYLPWCEQVAVGSNDGCVYMFSAEDGRLLWKLQTGGSVKAGFAFDEKRGLLVFGSFECCCYVVDIASGQVRYKFASGAIVYSDPLIHEGRLYFTSADKTLYCYGLDNGELLWNFKAKGRIFASPCIINGRLYIGSNDARLYELDPLTGQEAGFHQFVERITNKIAHNPATGRFFVPTFANQIYCLSKDMAAVTRPNKIEDNELKGMSEKYLLSALEFENETLIARPMDKQCKVAVVVSAYREDPATLLKLLQSFARQENVDHRSFEVDIVVANKKREAIEHTDAFRINQESLSLLRYLSGVTDRLPRGCEGCLHEIDEIKKSGLVVNCIDKSSEQHANVIDFSAVGRNRVGAEAVFRFLGVDAGAAGIIATIDCDCTVSSNYIAQIIRTYEVVPGLNGLSGDWKFCLENFNIPHKSHFEKAYSKFFLNAYGIHPVKERTAYGFEAKKGALCFASNTTTTVKSWVKAGGLPHDVGSEDVTLGKRLDKQDGVTGVSHGYFVTMDLRFSNRSGARGDGRIMALISKSIVDFFSGKSGHIWYLNNGAIGSFDKQVVQACRAGTINGELLERFMRENGFDPSGFTKAELEELAQEYRHYMTATGKDNKDRFAWLIDYRLFPAFPKRDIAPEIVEPRLYRLMGIIRNKPAVLKLYSFLYRRYHKRKLAELDRQLSAFSSNPGIARSGGAKSNGLVTGGPSPEVLLKLEKTISTNNAGSVFLKNIVSSSFSINSEDKSLRELAEKYLIKVLENESRTLIRRPMHPACRVAVMVPVYNEEHSTLLDLLESLAAQTGVGKEKFEVNIIVNNNRAEVLVHSKGFLANQSTLELLKFLSGESDALNIGQPERARVERVKSCGLAENYIDKSSFDNADEINFVGTAKNRAGAEMVLRFLQTSQEFRGIIAMTDCDYMVTNNYISEIIASYDSHKGLNGLSGGWKFRFDNVGMPHKKYFAKAFTRFLNSYNLTDEPVETAGSTLEVKRGVIKFSGNMTVTAKAWVLAGGMPKDIGSEDIIFSRRIEGLPGDTAVNRGYGVVMMVRLSDRTGARGDGRIMALISKSIVDFFSGKSGHIWYLNNGAIGSFDKQVVQACRAGTINGELLERFMRENGFDPSGFTKAELEELAQEYRHYMTATGKDNKDRFAWLIDYRLFPAFPKRDIAPEIVEPRLYRLMGIIRNKPAVLKLYSFLYRRYHKRKLAELEGRLRDFSEHKQ